MTSSGSNWCKGSSLLAVPPYLNGVSTEITTPRDYLRIPFKTSDKAGACWDGPSSAHCA